MRAGRRGGPNNQVKPAEKNKQTQKKKNEQANNQTARVRAGRRGGPNNQVKTRKQTNTKTNKY